MDWKKWAVGAAVVVALITTMCFTHKKPPPENLGEPFAVMYSHMRGPGEPFIIDGAHGGTAIDSAACKEQARYDVFVIDADKRDRPPKKALKYIRSLNPNAKMLGYFTSGGFYVCGDGWYGQTPPPYGCDTTQFTWQMYRLAQKHHAILFDTSGGPIMMATGVGVDFAQPGFASELADLIVRWANGTGVFTPGGVFNDGPCISIAGWYPGNTTDFRRQGYETMAEWDADYQTGVNDFYARLRQRLGPDAVIVGNCGPEGPKTANGWTGENFPYQNPSTWDKWNEVLSRADTAYTKPSYSFITTPRRRWQTADGVWHVEDFMSPEVQRQLRFVMGSAMMHDATSGILVGSTFDPLRGFMADQYSDLFHSMGIATGPQTTSGVVHRRCYSKGWVLVNPTGNAAKQTVEGQVFIVPPYDAVFLLK